MTDAPSLTDLVVHAAQKASKISGDQSPVLISSSNNLVFRAQGPNGPVAVKVIVDKDIDALYLRQTTEELTGRLPVPSIIDMVIPADPADPAVIMMDYIDGHSLSTPGVLDDPEIAAAFADLLVQCLEAVPALTPYFYGPGLFKKGAKSKSDLPGFWEAYFNKYIGRVASCCDDSDFLNRVSDWNRECLTLMRRDANGFAISVVSIDMNLRNFVYDGRRIHVLNHPILGNSIQDHSVGSIFAQTAGTAAQGIVTERLISEGKVGPFVPYFNIWMSMGILSFYAGQKVDDIAAATNWGSSVPLMSCISAVMDQHSNPIR